MERNKDEDQRKIDNWVNVIFWVILLGVFLIHYLS